MKKIVLFLLVGLLVSTSLIAQPSRVKWQRRSDPISYELYLFHSTHVVNLPTAETLQKSNFESYSKNFQYYGQFIANTLIAKKFGIGVRDLI